MYNASLLISKIFSLRAISMVLVCAFISQDISFAASDVWKAQSHASWLASHSEKEKASQLAWARRTLPTIPASIAKIEDAWKTPSGTERLVVLIQDAHTNPSCQLNEARLLNLLVPQGSDPCGTVTIFTEGGKGNLNLSELRRYKSQAERERIARSYLQRGLLHGVEYLDITGTKNFHLHGVEDRSLYTKALFVYRDTAREKAGFEGYLDRVDSAVATLKSKILNPILLDFVTAFQGFQAAPEKQVSLLLERSQVLGISLEKFPRMKTLKELRVREKEINFEKANAEQAAFLSKLPGAQRRELLEAVASKEPKVQEAFTAMIEEKLAAQSSGDYPQLTKYLQYRKLFTALDLTDTLKEEMELKKAVIQSLTATPEEEKLLKLAELGGYFRKLLDLSLSPEEYAAYKAKKETLASVTGFINQKFMELKADYDKALFLEPGFDEALAKAEKFYELTYRRDEKFVENMQKHWAHEAETASLSVLITGGFHTHNLKNLLKQKNISYISVIPQILRETNTKRYEDTLLSQIRKKTPEIRVTAAPARATGMLINGYLKGRGVMAAPPIAKEMVAELGASFRVLIKPLAAARLASPEAKQRERLKEGLNFIFDPANQLGHFQELLWRFSRVPGVGRLVARLAHGEKMPPGEIREISGELFTAAHLEDTIPGAKVIGIGIKNGHAIEFDVLLKVGREVWVVEAKEHDRENSQGIFQETTRFQAIKQRREINLLRRRGFNITKYLVVAGGPRTSVSVRAPYGKLSDVEAEAFVFDPHAAATGRINRGQIFPEPTLELWVRGANAAHVMEKYEDLKNLEPLPPLFKPLLDAVPDAVVGARMAKKISPKQLRSGFEEAIRAVQVLRRTARKEKIPALDLQVDYVNHEIRAAYRILKKRTEIERYDLDEACFYLAGAWKELATYSREFNDLVNARDSVKNILKSLAAFYGAETNYFPASGRPHVIMSARKNFEEIKKEMLRHGPEGTSFKDETALRNFLDFFDGQILAFPYRVGPATVYPGHILQDLGQLDRSCEVLEKSARSVFKGRFDVQLGVIRDFFGHFQKMAFYQMQLIDIALTQSEDALKLMDHDGARRKKISMRLNDQRRRGNNFRVDSGYVLNFGKDTEAELRKYFGQQNEDLLLYPVYQLSRLRAYLGGIRDLRGNLIYQGLWQHILMRGKAENYFQGGYMQSFDDQLRGISIDIEKNKYGPRFKDDDDDHFTGLSSRDRQELIRDDTYSSHVPPGRLFALRETLSLLKNSSAQSMGARLAGELIREIGQEPAPVVAAARLSSESKSKKVLLFDLPAIRASLEEVQKNFSAINPQLGSQRDEYTAGVLEGVMRGYGFINWMLWRELSLRPDLMVEINLLCHLAPDVGTRIHNASFVHKTHEKFYYYLDAVLGWYERHQKDSAWNIAAGMYVRILAQPQLFIEGNHRSGSLIASFILASQGLPGFVLTTENAIDYFNLSSDIKFPDRSVSTYFKHLFFWKTEKDRMQEFLKSNNDKKFMVKVRQDEPGEIVPGHLLKREGARLANQHGNLSDFEKLDESKRKIVRQQLKEMAKKTFVLVIEPLAKVQPDRVGMIVEALEWLGFYGPLATENFYNLKSAEGTQVSLLHQVAHRNPGRGKEKKISLVIICETNRRSFVHKKDTFLNAYQERGILAPQFEILSTESLSTKGLDAHDYQIVLEKTILDWLARQSLLEAKVEPAGDRPVKKIVETRRIFLEGAVPVVKHLMDHSEEFLTYKDFEGVMPMSYLTIRRIVTLMERQGLVIFGDDRWVPTTVTKLGKEQKNLSSHHTFQITPGGLKYFAGLSKGSDVDILDKVLTANNWRGKSKKSDAPKEEGVQRLLRKIGIVIDLPVDQSEFRALLRSPQMIKKMQSLDPPLTLREIAIIAQWCRGLTDEAICDEDEDLLPVVQVLHARLEKMAQGARLASSDAKKPRAVSTVDFLKAAAVIASATVVFLTFFQGMSFFVFRPLSIVIGNVAASFIQKESAPQKYVYRVLLAGLVSIPLTFVVAYYVGYLGVEPPGPMYLHYWKKTFEDLFLWSNVVTIPLFAGMTIKDMNPMPVKAWFKKYWEMVVQRTAAYYSRGGFLKINVLYWTPLAAYNYYAAASIDEIHSILIVAGMLYALPLAYFSTQGNSADSTVDEPIFFKLFVRHAHWVPSLMTGAWLAYGLWANKPEAIISSSGILLTTLAANWIVEGVFYTTAKVFPLLGIPVPVSVSKKTLGARLAKDDPARYELIELPSYIQRDSHIQDKCYKDMVTGQLFLAYSMSYGALVHGKDQAIYTEAIRAGFDNVTEIRLLSDQTLLTKIVQTYSDEEIIGAHTRAEDWLLYMLYFMDWDHLAKNIYSRQFPSDQPSSDKKTTSRYLIYDLDKAIYPEGPPEPMPDFIRRLIISHSPRFRAPIDRGYAYRRIEELHITQGQEAFLRKGVDLVIGEPANGKGVRLSQISSKSDDWIRQWKILAADNVNGDPARFHPLLSKINDSFKSSAYQGVPEQFRFILTLPGPVFKLHDAPLTAREALEAIAVSFIADSKEHPMTETEIVSMESAIAVFNENRSPKEPPLDLESLFALVLKRYLNPQAPSENLGQPFKSDSEEFYALSQNLRFLFGREVLAALPDNPVFFKRRLQLVKALALFHLLQGIHFNSFSQDTPHDLQIMRIHMDFLGDQYQELKEIERQKLSLGKNTKEFEKLLQAIPTSLYRVWAVTMSYFMPEIEYQAGKAYENTLLGRPFIQMPMGLEEEYTAYFLKNYHFMKEVSTPFLSSDKDPALLGLRLFIYRNREFGFEEQMAQHGLLPVDRTPWDLFFNEPHFERFTLSPAGNSILYNEADAFARKRLFREALTRFTSAARLAGRQKKETTGRKSKTTVDSRYLELDRQFRPYIMESQKLRRPRARKAQKGGDVYRSLFIGNGPDPYPLYESLVLGAQAYALDSDYFASKKFPSHSLSVIEKKAGVLDVNIQGKDASARFIYGEVRPPYDGRVTAKHLRSQLGAGQKITFDHISLLDFFIGKMTGSSGFLAFLEGDPTVDEAKEVYQAVLPLLKDGGTLEISDETLHIASHSLLALMAGVVRFSDLAQKPRLAHEVVEELLKEKGYRFQRKEAGETLVEGDKIYFYIVHKSGARLAQSPGDSKPAPVHVMEILQYLAKKKEACFTYAELAEAMQIHLQSAKTIILRLEKAGLVERGSDRLVPMTRHSTFMKNQYDAGFKQFGISKKAILEYLPLEKNGKKLYLQSKLAPHPKKTPNKKPGKNGEKGLLGDIFPASELSRFLQKINEPAKFYGTLTRRQTAIARYFLSGSSADKIAQLKMFSWEEIQEVYSMLKEAKGLPDKKDPFSAARLASPTSGLNLNQITHQRLRQTIESVLDDLTLKINLYAGTFFTREDVAKWLTQETLLDLGPGREAEMLSWLWALGSEQAYGLDVYYDPAVWGPHQDRLLKGDFREAWPFEENQFGFISSLFSLGPRLIDEDPFVTHLWDGDTDTLFNHVVSEIRRILHEDGLFVDLTGLRNAELGRALEESMARGELFFQSERIENGFWLVTYAAKKPLPEVFRGIGQRILAARLALNPKTIPVAQWLMLAPQSDMSVQTFKMMAARRILSDRVGEEVPLPQDLLLGVDNLLKEPLLVAGPGNVNFLERLVRDGGFPAEGIYAIDPKLADDINPRYVKGMIENAPASWNGTFHTIFASDLLKYVNVAQFIEAASCILKTGGELVIYEADRSTENPNFNFFMEQIAKMPDFKVMDAGYPAGLYVFKKELVEVGARLANAQSLRLTTLDQNLLTSLLLEKYTLDSTKAGELAPLIRDSVIKPMGSYSVLIYQGQKFAEISLLGSVRYFDQNGRWILTLDPFDNPIEQLEWDRDNRFIKTVYWAADRLEYEMSSAKKVIWDRIPIGKVATVHFAGDTELENWRGMEDMMAVFCFYEGLDLTDKPGQVSGAGFGYSYGPQNIPLGLGYSTLNLIAQLASDKKQLLSYIGDVPTRMIDNGLDEVGVRYRIPSQSSGNRLAVFRWQPAPSERIFYPNGLFVSLRGGFPIRAFYGIEMFKEKNIKADPSTAGSFTLNSASKTSYRVDLKGNVEKLAAGPARPEGARLAAPDFKIHENHFDANFLAKMSGADKEIYALIVSGSLQSLDDIRAASKKYPREILISSSEVSGLDSDDGRTLYLALESAIDGIRFIRFKGVRPRLGPEGKILPYTSGDGFAGWPWRIDGAGCLTTVNVLEQGLRGALLPERAQKEDTMMRVLGAAGVNVDVPLGWAVMRDASDPSQEFGWVAAGMAESDTRLVALKYIHTFDINEYFEDLGKPIVRDSLSQNDIIHIFSELGRQLRLVHRQGYVHQYPHFGNIGLSLEQDGRWKVILRDLDTAEKIPDSPDPLAAARFRFLDFLKVLENFYQMQKMGNVPAAYRAFINSYFSDSSSQEIESVLSEVMGHREVFAEPLLRVIEGNKPLSVPDCKIELSTTDLILLTESQRQTWLDNPFKATIGALAASSKRDKLSVPGSVVAARLAFNPQTIPVAQWLMLPPQSEKSVQTFKMMAARRLLSDRVGEGVPLPQDLLLGVDNLLKGPLLVAGPGNVNFLERLVRDGGFPAEGIYAIDPKLADDINPRYVKGMIENAPASWNGTFHTIFASDLLKYVNVAQFIEAASCILKTGGELVIYEADRSTENPNFNFFMEQIAKMPDFKVMDAGYPAGLYVFKKELGVAARLAVDADKDPMLFRASYPGPSNDSLGEWHPSIREMFPLYSFAAVQFSEPGILFRASGAGLLEAIETDAFGFSKDENPMVEMERSYDLFFISEDLSDAISASEFWRLPDDGYLAVFSSEIFNAALQKKSAAVFRTAEAGMLFKYPFLTGPLTAKDICLLIVTKRAKELLDEKWSREGYPALSEKTAVIELGPGEYDNGKVYENIQEHLRRRGLVPATAASSSIFPGSAARLAAQRRHEITEFVIEAARNHSGPFTSGVIVIGDQKVGVELSRDHSWMTLTGLAPSPIRVRNLQKRRPVRNRLLTVKVSTPELLNEIEQSFYSQNAKLDDLLAQVPAVEMNTPKLLTLDLQGLEAGFKQEAFVEYLVHVLAEASKDHVTTLLETSGDGARLAERVLQKAAALYGERQNFIFADPLKLPGEYNERATIVTSESAVLASRGKNRMILKSSGDSAWFNLRADVKAATLQAWASSGLRPGTRQFELVKRAYQILGVKIQDDEAFARVISGDESVLSAIWEYAVLPYPAPIDLAFRLYQHLARQTEQAA